MTKRQASKNKPAGKRRRWLGCLSGCGVLMVLFVVATIGAGDQARRILATTRVPLPTVAVSPAESTPASTPTSTLTFDEMEATSVQLAEQLRPGLEALADLQGVQRISALELRDGWSIELHLDIAPADDNEFTMDRVLAAVQDEVETLSAVRVLSYVNGVLQRNWLWEDGEWSSVTMGVRAVPSVTAIPITVRSVGVRCPANCTEAVALGWTAQQAAQCSHLDRDGDGVACYGD